MDRYRDPRRGADGALDARTARVQGAADCPAGIDGVSIVSTINMETGPFLTTP